jgi:hypothetical protein
MGLEWGPLTSLLKQTEELLQYTHLSAEFGTSFVDQWRPEYIFW